MFEQPHHWSGLPIWVLWWPLASRNHSPLHANPFPPTKVFQQPHHWSADLGPVVAIGMSTVRYRSNANSHHEVHIDEAQLAWVEEELEKYKDK